MSIEQRVEKGIVDGGRQRNVKLNVEQKYEKARVDKLRDGMSLNLRLSKDL
jgi:hypothetical protein